MIGAPDFRNTRLHLGTPGFRVTEGKAHAPEVKVCRSCRGRKIDRHGFDCRTCFGEGTVDE